MRLRLLSVRCGVRFGLRTRRWRHGTGVALEAIDARKPTQVLRRERLHGDRVGAVVVTCVWVYFAASRARALANREAAPLTPLCARLSPRLRRNGRPRAPPLPSSPSRTRNNSASTPTRQRCQKRNEQDRLHREQRPDDHHVGRRAKRKDGALRRDASAYTKKIHCCPAPRRAQRTPAARPRPAHRCGEAVDAAREARRRPSPRERARRIETRRRARPPRHRRAQATSPARASRPACCTTATS